MRLEVSTKQIPGTLPFSKEIARRTLLTSTLTIRDVCRSFGGQDHWRKFYNDMWKWRQTDPDFKSVYDSYSKRIGMKPVASPTGRPKADAEDKNWRERFCEDLYRFDGDREKASHSTPYSFHTLIQKLKKGYSSYDEEFANMVQATELQIAARAEAMIISAANEFNDKHMQDSSLDTVNRARVLEMKSRVAEKIVSRLDPDRWGKQRLDINQNVKVDVRVKTIDQRRDMVQELLASQREALLSKGISKPIALPEHVEDAILIDADDNA